MLQEDGREPCLCSTLEGMGFVSKCRLASCKDLDSAFYFYQRLPAHVRANQSKPLADCWEQPGKGGSIFMPQLLSCAKSSDYVPLCLVHPQHWLTRRMEGVKLLGKL